MKLLIALLLSFSFFTHAKTDASLALDMKKSKVNWFAKKVVGDDNHKGFIPIKSANVTLNEKGEVSGGTFVMDMTGFESTDLSGKWKKKFEGHLKSEDFFNVSKKGHDTATVKITEVKDGKAKGELTLNGVTKPINLTFKKDGMMYKGSYTMDRTKWNIKYGSNSFFDNLGDKAIANEVKIDFQIVATKDTTKKNKKK